MVIRALFQQVLRGARPGAGEGPGLQPPRRPREHPRTGGHQRRGKDSSQVPTSLVHFTRVEGFNLCVSPYTKAISPLLAFLFLIRPRF